jgi:glycosyltransferase involved in cell wall biosynthesis
MRILMVALDLNPPWIEGIRNSVRELSHRLIKRGHEVHCISKGSKGQLEDEVIEGMVYHRVNVGTYETYGEKMHKFFLKAPSRIRKVVKENNINVVHGHSSYPIMGSLEGFSLVGKDIGKVFSLYSSSSSAKSISQYPLTLRVGLRFSKSNKLTRLNAKVLDRIVATSRKVEKQILSLSIAPNRVMFIPLGVDLERFNPELDKQRVRRELKIGFDDKLALFAGDLTPWKGAEVLLKAVHQVRKRLPSLKVLLLTKGTYEYEEERLHTVKQLIEELELEDAVFILGRRTDLPYVYAASDIVVMPFLDNYALMDTPLSLLEAMACGKPVIASKIGGMPEILRENETGVTVNPGDENELAEALFKVVNDNDLAKTLGHNGRKIVVSNHDWDDISMRMEDIYSEVSKI